MPLRRITADSIVKYQRERRAKVSGRTVDLEVGLLRRILRRHKQCVRLTEDAKMLPERPKPARLVKLGIALGAGLEGDVHVQVRNALAGGITRVELRHVVLLGLTTVGFPASMTALTWVNDLLGGKRQRRKKW